MAQFATPRRTSADLWIGVAAIALLVFGCILILLPFISAALWAVILCFTTWPLFSMLRRALGGRGALAALLSTLMLTAIIVAPLAILGASLAGNVSEVIAATQRLIHEGPPKLPEWIAQLPLVGARISQYWDLLNESSTTRIAELAKLLPAAEAVLFGGGRALGEGMVQIILSLVIAFFLYSGGDYAAARLNVAATRIAGEEGARLLEVAGATIRAVVFGILGTALLQGVLAAIGFLIAGVPGAILLGFLTFIIAAVPAAPLLIAALAGVWLYREDAAFGWVVFMVVWGAIVTSLDSVVKPYLISRGGTTPVILIMLGVVGGAMEFGLIGLFLGPTLVAIGYRVFDEWSGPVALRVPAAPPGD
ncbi:MAG TPA: AI-2E family transporter [Candidatus Binataceae bacterium]|nr:AI-2E family transporter [Candidatus Binataceae bacterium]